jgi:hypothetical protein
MTLSRLPALASAVIVVASLSAGGAHAQALQPGLWEITMRMEMPGAAMAPVTMQQCIRDASPESAVPQPPSCTLVSRSVSGNTMRWTARCQEGGMVMQGTGEMTMYGATYEGSLQMTVEGAGERQQMSQRYSGRRIGEC